MAKKKSVQPKPKKGYTFISWGISNWGFVHQRTFRTRNDAIEWILDGRCAIGITTWKQASKHFKVFKVKSTVM